MGSLPHGNTLERNHTTLTDETHHWGDSFGEGSWRKRISGRLLLVGVLVLAIGI